MARADDGTGKGAESGDGSYSGAYSGASDARLTELLRADTASAYAALQELRARHRPAVLAHARLCTTSESAARQLAAQAFTLAARETARGIDPGVPWRHRLLLLAGRVAAGWARDERAAGLEAGLLLVLNSAPPGGPVPPLCGPFRSLPARTQGLVWYGIVEQEPADRTADFLGLTHEDVVYGVEQALQAMAQACLKSRLAASDDPQCGDFRRLIEESVRPDHPRVSADLHTHMAHCGHCSTAHEELSALRDNPRATLADGLLPWAGTAYVTEEGANPDAHARRGLNTRPSSAAWPPPRTVILASAVALGVALAPLLVLLLSPDDASTQSPVSSQQAVGSTVVPPPPPPVTVTATVSATPSPSATSRRPSPKPSPTRTKTPRPKPPTPKPSPTHPPDGTFAQVVNVASGLCLDIRDGYMEKGTDVVTAPCDSSRTQRWRVDSRLDVLQSYADPDFCLDSRGDVDRGVGIWECDSVYGYNGDNLRFTVDDDGVIRPAIAIATAVTPAYGESLFLERLSGGAEQRWRAGTS
ncbi:ricin-type beta-trefoil lectin domain protein [Streptomyces sp. HUCO-GS316]|uniref:RICIN domain-containing protein n=1 Tax=Streptomyces sp. HUCO-GS316 TaxID=2692198 RepID=UPI0013690535|nr:RICIN domain-containing protein [Streptomyces sp. HUCO-GS316]MXM67111.1 ricin-type beta-trefoil lectin domain protein [Streptomyces sp. HUCO-GS316]